MSGLHVRLADVALPYALLVLAGCLVQAARGRGPGRLVSAGLGLLGSLVVLAAIAGLAAALGGARPADPGLHWLYGLVAICVLPALGAYTRALEPRLRSVALAVAVVGLIVMLVRQHATGASHAH